MKLKDKIAIITGSGGGIGRVIALALAKEGAKIVVADVNKETAKKTAEEIKNLGGDSLAVKVDVRSSTEVEAMVQEALKKFSRIDILVNNAGVSMAGRCIDSNRKEGGLLPLTEEIWDCVMDINAKGVFLCTKAAARVMISQGQGGKIVNISSMAGKTAGLFASHYCASKAAVILFAKAVALELAPHKINVNSVCPGWVKGGGLYGQYIARQEKFRGITQEELEKRISATTPLGRLEKPEDVAKLVVFLCSEDSEFMTGQAINVTGGIETH